MNARVLNDVVFDDKRSIWRIPGEQTISYSDGTQVEAYLAKVLGAAQDLASGSRELERYIVDWPTEYHLSRKRAYLLKGFGFDKRYRALEVGCGCGAITRFLGETFDDVIAVEGSPTRAAIARLRTRDQPNVSVLNAPFQDVKFKEPFDIVFCIGVFEYAGMFVKADDPWDRVLEYLESILSPKGILVLAIENQFGLKYFSSSREDHTGIMFDGIEGYHRDPRGPRTFGYYELKERLARYFPRCEFYFPYPDYKTPCCILSEEMLSKVPIGELMAEFAAPAGPTATKPLFHEQLALGEIARNNMLPFFANSFLVVARKGDRSLGHDWLAVLHTTHARRPEFETITRILEEGGRVLVKKSLLSGQSSANIGKVRLEPTVSPWVEGRSLQQELVRRFASPGNKLCDILQPTLLWYKKLKSLSVERDGVRWIDGRYVDAIWSNTFIGDGQVSFIDPEWRFSESIRLSYLLIKSFLVFFNDMRVKRALHRCMRVRSLVRMIKEAAAIYGFRITADDFRHFISTELEFSQTVLGLTPGRLRSVCALKWRLWASPTVRIPGNLLRKAAWLGRKLKKQLIVLQNKRGFSTWRD